MTYMGKDFKKEWLHIYIYKTDSLGCIPETNNVVNQLYSKRKKRKVNITAVTPMRMHQHHVRLQVCYFVGPGSGICLCGSSLVLVSRGTLLDSSMLQICSNLASVVGIHRLYLASWDRVPKGWIFSSVWLLPNKLNDRNTSLLKWHGRTPSRTDISPQHLFSLKTTTQKPLGIVWNPPRKLPDLQWS